MGHEPKAVIQEETFTDRGSPVPRLIDGPYTVGNGFCLTNFIMQSRGLEQTVDAALAFLESFVTYMKLILHTVDSTNTREHVLYDPDGALVHARLADRLQEGVLLAHPPAGLVKVPTNQTDRLPRYRVTPEQFLYILAKPDFNIKGEKICGYWADMGVIGPYLATFLHFCIVVSVYSQEGTLQYVQEFSPVP